MGKRNCDKEPVDDSYFKNIPGHFYDETTRKLFKLAGNEYTCINGVLTKKKIETEKTEKKRLKDLLNDLKSSSHKRISIPQMLNQRQIETKIHHFNREICSSFFSALKSQGHFDLSTFTGTSDESHLSRITEGPSKDSMALVVEGCNVRALKLVTMDFSKRGVMLKKDETCHDSTLEKDNLECSIDIKSSVLLNEKVVDFVWHSLNECTIFTKAAGFNEPSYIHLRRENNIDSWALDDNILSGSCFEKNIVAFGHEFGAKLCEIDQDYRPIRSLNSDICQVHSVKFSRDGKVVYYGDLKGKIRLYDTRDRLVHNLITLEKRARVDSFYECRDNNYLVIGFGDGRILKFDARMKLFVSSYEEHKNDYLKTPIIVNQTEEYLTAVGTDCYTRIWDFKTSELLRTIPPPLSVTRSQIPAVCFIPQMNETRSSPVPGLILSVKQKVFLYSR